MTDPTNYRTNRDLFSNHYLNDHLHDMEAWTEIPDAEVETAFSEIKSILDEKGDRVEDYNEAQLERNVIRPIFEILEIPFEIEETVMRNARRPDYGFFPSAEAADAAFDRENFYQEAIAVADAKRWGRKLDTRGEEKRDFENPSYQIHSYLQETPPQWGVLTNGEKWRLYYGPTSHRLDSYYEIDLPKVLSIGEEEGDLEAFKEFYLFFRQGAFLDDQTGDCFLDDVYDQSTAFAEALGEDLQENIYEAIRVLAEGFLDTNDNLDEEDLDRIHDSSLIYLYRLIFVLYAESEGRNLLPTENEIYSETYSLNDLKQVVVEKRDETQQHYQTWQTDLWDKLDELFVLIDQGSQGKGIPKDDLYIPAYNGGLFRTDPEEDDTVEAQFLSNHEVGDAYIAEVIELLTRHEASEGQGKVFVDYSSLDERNLGSIYEGLLEYKLDVADEPLTVDDGEYVAAGEGDDVTVEEGEVYLRTDDGERKATGSYYTPEYVVEYIVDETLGPLVQEIREDLIAKKDQGFAEEFADRVFDLTVLDPAMGSGHFPVNAVDYLAREIIDAQEQQDRQALDSADAEIRAPTTEEGELRDINWARRKVAQRCIYGVDVNPLATELAKVSLWLRTLAAEQPLAFLDHHLKTGNSLVGSDIEDVLSDGDDKETDDGQLTLQQSFDHTRQRAMEHVTDRFQDLLNIDNETLEDAKEMEAVYDDVRDDPLYKKLLAMANVHTAEAFGLDIPTDAYERMARALHSDVWENIEKQDWFNSAQSMAEDERFFHWELEFPMAFYNQDGERKSDAGFDAVIGNPPYVRQEKLSEIKDYVEKNFQVYDGKADIYSYFFELGLNISRLNGSLGYISSNRFITANYGSSLRSYLAEESGIRKMIDFKDLSVFPGITTYPAIFILEKGTQNDIETEYVDVESLSFTDLGRYVESESVNIPSKNFGETWRLRSKRTNAVLDKIDEKQRLKKYIDGEINRGIVTGLNDAFIIGKETKEKLESEDENSSEIIKPLISGNEIRRFYHESPTEYLIYATWDLDIDEYPAVKAHLQEWRDELESRPECQQGRFDWFCLSRYAADYESDFGSSKILYPEVSKNARFAIDTEGIYPNKTAFIIPHQDYHLLSILNSTISELYLHSISSRMRGGYYMNSEIYVEDIPIAGEESMELSRSDLSHVDNLLSKYSDIRIEGDSVEISSLSPVGKIMVHLQAQRRKINPDLIDNLGNYNNTVEISTIGLLSPAENSSASLLSETKTERSNLRIGTATVERESRNTVLIKATARYKPEDEDAHETDQWGYTETNYLPAFRLTNLTDTEADLVEHFVPVAVDQAGGFANFRDTATKTNSPVDRLKAIELPDPDNVSDDLENYLQIVERGEELDEKIAKTDDLIDEIVYELYDLTDEEIEIVEEAVDDD
ncbi:Eco57I restriction-modification methylase domain-containing protein [Halorubrum sp. Atlit-28R]|uniref:Eco57I restriction-modification methylase domain-containing protein n=1 Tax=Halorubrum sp. Atlit-28R TaxID=2282129 RepID=UPI000EF27CF4|nr:Eco57I restriction-modification methylase domain-containing protein [Halorubrum sp. Atlit-28R]RLM49884.1 class I SAM-dependent DNA methyltransferase [Halorubrum sp. Atlit-28R]